MTHELQKRGCPVCTGFQGTGMPQTVGGQEKVSGQASQLGNQCSNFIKNTTKKSHTMQQGSCRRIIGRGERRGKEGGRGGQMPVSGDKSDGRDRQEKEREGEREEVHKICLLKGNNIANVHRGCSKWLQLRMRPATTPSVGQYRCLNINTLLFSDFQSALLKVVPNNQKIVQVGKLTFPG